MADENLNLSISDPLSANIQALSGLGAAAFNFLCTPQGQLLVEDWRKDSAAAKVALDAWAKQISDALKAGDGNWWTRATAWIKGLFPA